MHQALPKRAVRYINFRVLTIFDLFAKNDTQIHTVWMPREQNAHADYVSRIIDIDDWAISTEFFHSLMNYGIHTV